MGDRRGGRGNRGRQNRGGGPKFEKPRGNIKQVDENSPVIQAFRGYQVELDQRYDKHERIVKLSRDITIESKRIIFLLHRVSGTTERSEILKEAEEKMTEIEVSKFKEIAAEVEGQDPHQFIRAYSAGLQEFIEALSFYVYLQDKRLISLKEVESRLTFSRVEQVKPDTADTQQTGETVSETGDQTSDVKTDSENGLLSVPVPPGEYMLGIADLTGEVMRLAINSVGSGDLDLPQQIRVFLQEMESGYVGLDYASREISRKLTTLKQSTRKVETACYTLQVRGSEIPKHMLAESLCSDELDGFHDDQIHDDN